jgi:hypothetical protein
MALNLQLHVTPSAMFLNTAPSLCALTSEVPVSTKIACNRQDDDDEDDEDDE